MILNPRMIELLVDLIRQTIPWKSRLGDHVPAYSVLILVNYSDEWVGCGTSPDQASSFVVQAFLIFLLYIYISDLKQLNKQTRVMGHT